jgi:curli production assembly/transport component CsgG
MRRVLLMLSIIPPLLSGGGCAQLGPLKDSVGTAVAMPGTGVLPPTPGAVTETSRKLRDLPPPQHPVAVAVYGYGDQTGQAKPLPQGAAVTSMSRAVTQGATSIVIKTLQDAGNGRWFTVIERERLDNLLKERRIISDMRMRYLGETGVNPDALPPLLFAGVLIDGGIIGYDSNTKTGGAGANYFGLGGDVSYSEDTVTVYLRGTSVKTGQVLLSVTASKKILSYGIEANFYRYVTFNRLLQAEVGLTRNEPGSLAVQEAIEQAVMQFIVEGSARDLWTFGDKAVQRKLIGEYDLSYLAAAHSGTASANAGGERTASAANGQGKQQKAGLVPAKAPATAGNGGPAQATPAAQQQPQPPLQSWITVIGPPGQPQNAPQAGQGQPAPGAGPQQQLAAPPIRVLPRTLEDEVPIVPR